MSWQNDFIKYAENYSPNEACGLFAIIEGKEKFWPCKNLAEGKHQFFIIDPDDWASCEDAGEILGVVHSHPVSASTPSNADKASCEHLGFPYYIYSVKHKSWNKLEPLGWKTPSLIGRKWIWGKHDCWSVISDWTLGRLDRRGVRPTLVVVFSPGPGAHTTNTDGQDGHGHTPNTQHHREINQDMKVTNPTGVRLGGHPGPSAESLRGRHWHACDAAEAA